ncbi:hypothetical protein AX16_008629 [Volvariella volvacea WC 439]|nr:hypothetical protein AX16_008629 [Volvariella volvacea WC 439]
MSRPGIYVKYEENTRYFTYGGGQWSYNVDDRWSGRGQTWPAFAGDPGRTLGNITFTFRGTSVAFIGNTPPIQSSQMITVSIDGDEPYNASYNDPAPQSYRQWYQSPILPDGEHTIYIDDIDLTSVDYTLVTAGESTPLQTQDSLVVVDDEDINHFAFRGNWTRDPGLFFGPLNGTPFGNATRRTHTPGDQMSFRFSGTSFALYGVFLLSVTGTITANYTIDAASPTEVTYTGGPFLENAHLDEQPHFLFFKADKLTPGEHTVVMTVTDVVNQTLIFDYATYTPSFASITDMPILGPISSPTNTSNSDGAPSDDSVSSSTPAGAIVGAAIGSLALIIIALLMWYFIRRRRLSTQREQKAGLNKGGHFAAPVPFTMTMAEREPFSAPRKSAEEARGESQPQVRTSLPQFGRYAPATRSQHSLSASTSSGVPLLQNHIPPASTSLGPNRRTLSERQVELQGQMRELESRIRLLNQNVALAGPSQAQFGPVSPQNDELEILELRRQIEELRRENAMLSTPPAYEERDRNRVSEAGAGLSTSFPATSTQPQPQSRNQIAPNPYLVRALPVEQQPYRR